MSRKLIDYNPLTGESTWFDYEASTDTTKIIEMQDGAVVQSILDDAQRLANSNDYTKSGMKRDMWHYARIPMSVLQLMNEKYGVQYKEHVDWPKMFKLLNTEFTRFKTTHKTHNIKNA